MKSVRIRSYSGPHLPAFGLNNSEYGHFSRSVSLSSVSTVFAQGLLLSINLQHIEVFTSSKLTIKTLEKSMEYVQS